MANEIAKALGLPEEQVPTIVPEPEPSETREDLDTARETILNTISRTEDAISKLEELAESSEHPRMYEVLAAMYRTRNESARDLINLQRQKQEIKKTRVDLARSQRGPIDATSGITQVNHNLFVGTSNELLELIKKTQQPIKTIDGNI